MSPIQIIAVSAVYLMGAIAFNAMQIVYNKLMGRKDPHYAEAWFVGTFWFPLMVWVLVHRLARFSTRIAKAISHAP